MSDSDEDNEVTYSDNEGSMSPRSRGSRSPSPTSEGKSPRRRYASGSGSGSRSRSRSGSRSQSRSPSPKKKRRQRAHVDIDPAERARILNAAEDSEEEEDYEPTKRKRKRGGVSDFLDLEADVDDDADDDPEAWGDDYENDIYGGEREEAEAGISARDIEAKMRKDKERGGLGFAEEKLDEEAINAYYRNRYNEDAIAQERFGQSGEAMSDEITQQTLLPGVKDPNLWMVKCQIGMEKETLLKLMHKFLAFQHTDERLQIRSIVVPEHVKGYIYIEAFKQTHVKQAIEGVSNLRLGQWTQKMVPIKEMTDVLRVVKEQVGLKTKQWVRLKRGVFKDDLAQVDYVDMAQNQVSLKLLPRIDYSRFRGALRTSSSDDMAKRNKKKRPPSKLFDPEKVRSIGGEISNDGDFLLFEGNRFSRKGYLYKMFAMNAILAEGVKPTLTELEKFEEAPEGISIELATAADGKEESHAFSNGDNVEVIEGELVNLQGKVIGIEGMKITIMPKHEDLKEALEFSANELRKYFCQGDHVRVIGGR